MASLLIEKGAAVDHANKQRRHAAPLSCKQGHAAVASLLIDKGAAVDHADKDGDTPLLELQARPCGCGIAAD